jgi:hypothetical protein
MRRSLPVPCHAGVRSVTQVGGSDGEGLPCPLLAACVAAVVPPAEFVLWMSLAHDVGTPPLRTRLRLPRVMGRPLTAPPVAAHDGGA